MAEKNISIATMVSEAMEKKGLGIRDLAEELDLTYEHTRRIVRGEYTPNKFSLKSICDLLEIPLEEASKVAMGERIRKKYGVVADNLIARPKGLEPLEKVWDQLTRAQQKDVIVMASSWAENNRHEKVSKGA